MTESVKCQYIGCNEIALIKVPRSNSVFCEDHYLLNVLRFGCDLKGELIKKSKDSEAIEELKNGMLRTEK